MASSAGDRRHIMQQYEVLRSYALYDVYLHTLASYFKNLENVSIGYENKVFIVQLACLQCVTVCDTRA